MWAHWRRRQELGHESGPGGSQEGAPHAIGGGTPALEVLSQAAGLDQRPPPPVAGRSSTQLCPVPHRWRPRPWLYPAT